MINKIKTYSFLNFVVIFFLLIIYYPYVFADIFNSPLKQTGYVILCIFVVGLLLIFTKRITMVGHSVIKLVLILELICCTILFFYHHLNFNYIAAFATYLLTFASILIIKNNIGYINFIKYYNNWLVIMAIGAVITFFIAYLGIPPVFKYINGDGSEGYSWILSCMKYNRLYDASNIIRPSGYFDEPGALATWGMYGLIFNKLFVKNKNVEYVLLICLLITFSMAYYILLTAYIFVFYIKSYKQLLVLSTVIVFISVGIYSTKDTSMDTIYNLSFGRFEYDVNSDTFVGDNRSNLSEIAKAAFNSAPLMGVGPVMASKFEYMNDNPYTLLAVHGIFGTFFIYLPLICVIFLAINRKDMKLFGASLILFAAYMQRPFSFAFYIQYLMLFLYFTMCFELYFKTKNKQEQPIGT